MALFQKKPANNPVAMLENDLAATQRKRADLLSRRDKIAYSLDEAQQARKQAFLVDDSEESERAVDAATSNVESFRSSLQGVDLVLAEHDAKIADLEEQIKIGADRMAREQKALALEEKLNRARDAFPKYIAAARELSEALGGTGHFHIEEASALIARIARDVETAREMLFQHGEHAIAQLRADPPPKPVQPPPPPPGELSGFKRKFSTLSSPGAVGDDGERVVGFYGGFAGH